LLVSVLIFAGSVVLFVGALHSQRHWRVEKNGYGYWIVTGGGRLEVIRLDCVQPGTSQSPSVVYLRSRIGNLNHQVRLPGFVISHDDHVAYPGGPIVMFTWDILMLLYWPIFLSSLLPLWWLISRVRRQKLRPAFQVVPAGTASGASTEA
jgi:hypothetical protein